ncbi:MAG: CBS domain-containing protein [Methanomassiliicoccales archaeon]|nr:CBS domain-containing protein [Methanomassiliicoccales archaeon]
MQAKARVRDYVDRNPPTVDYGATLEDVLRLMLKTRKAGIVVREGGEILGTISAADTMRIIVEDRDPSKVKVKEFMSACTLVGKNPCVQIHEDGFVVDAIRLMLIGSVTRVLVIDSKGDFVGTISFLDALRAWEDVESRKT